MQDDAISISESSEASTILPEVSEIIQESIEAAANKVVVKPDSEVKKKSPSKVLECQLAFYTHSELKKPKGKPKAIAGFLSLDTSASFEALKSELLVQLLKQFSAASISTEGITSLDDFKLSFQVPRIDNNPSLLHDNESYGCMILRPVGEQGQVLCEPKHAASSTMKRKESIDSSDVDTDAPPKPKKSKTSKKPASEKENKKTTKIPKAVDLDGANKPINDNIKLLKAAWSCSKPNCRTTGWCYICPEDSSHLALGAQHLNVWAAAMLKGEDIATPMKPPNHTLFDAFPVKGAQTMLQRRAVQNKVDAAPPPQQQPIQIINNIPAPVDSYQLRPGPQPVTTTQTTLLLPEHLKPGRRMPIKDFCSQYDLSDQMRTHLVDNEYTGTHTFRHITITDLKDMGFKSGAIAELKEAVLRWANSGEDVE
ncbi:hypothetical protein BV25DRAFT_1990735 [Artomyces pyxidatus]|uniref:Uncharacterized protein n=1 Tax=Artomyces pyxidatus TaxID=48021 RepID=A0ACB8T5D6_9AGAM|nr:hypothetical protein BV25DRAFT_1990735 [Artomyces pyxidatus]